MLIYISNFLFVENVILTSIKDVLEVNDDNLLIAASVTKEAVEYGKKH